MVTQVQAYCSDLLQKQLCRKKLGNQKVFLLLLEIAQNGWFIDSIDRGAQLRAQRVNLNFG